MLEPFSIIVPIAVIAMSLLQQQESQEQDVEMDVALTTLVRAGHIATAANQVMNHVLLDMISCMMPNATSIG